MQKPHLFQNQAILTSTYDTGNWEILDYIKKDEVESAVIKETITQFYANFQLKPCSYVGNVKTFHEDMPMASHIMVTKDLVAKSFSAGAESLS